MRIFAKSISFLREGVWFYKEAVRDQALQSAGNRPKAKVPQPGPTNGNYKRKRMLMYTSSYYSGNAHNFTTKLFTNILSVHTAAMRMRG